jgi:hypothetical protein
VKQRDVASETRRGVASKQGKRQEYTDVLSLHRQSLQNKQCFHNLHAYLSAARNKQDHGSVMSIGERGRDHGRIV